MTTFKAIVLKHHLKQDGTYNVKIAITHKGKRRFIPTNHYITSKQMTRGMKIKDVAVIEMLEELIQLMRKEVAKLGMVADNMPIDELVDIISTKVSKGERFTLKFIDYGKKKCKDMKPSTASVYMTTFNAILRFTRGKDIDISVITSQWLRNFVSFLDNEPGIHTKEQKKGRAVSLYTSNIRHIYNLAREEFNDEDREYFPIPYNPFNRFKVPKPPVPKEKALSVEIIQKIIDYEPKRNVNGVSEGAYHLEEIAKDMFLLSFGMIGMNGADIFEMGKVKNGVYDYERKKTRDRRDDRARMKVRVEPEMAEIMAKYKSYDKDREMVIAEHYKGGSQSFNNSINRGLARIADAIGVERFSFYSARHSWATIAHNVARIDKYLIHSAINHADGAMKITDIYITKDYSLFWEANRKVLNLFEWDYGLSL
jgi:integrase